MRIKFIKVLVALGSLFVLFNYFQIVTIIKVEATEVRSTELPLKVTTADDWNEIFRRRSGSGWYSGDGVYSIPMNGDDNPGSYTTTKTFWSFSDTHACSSNINTTTFEITGDKFMNHSVAVMNAIAGGGNPFFSDMAYKYGYHGDMTYSNIFGEKKWTLDGLYKDSNIYLFMLGYDTQTSKIDRVDRVKIPIVNNDVDLQNYVIDSTPLWSSTSDSEVRVGIGILDNTLQGGAFDSDGYIYIYGARTNVADGNMRGLVVARVLKHNFTDFSKWEYYDGTTWSSDFSVLDSPDAVLANDVALHCSVTPIKTGIYANKYMLIYMKKQQLPVIEYRIGDTPVGPWSDAVPLYYVYEHEEYSMDQVEVYNAKAHPHLSSSNELLVSYCVNVRQPTIKTNDKNRARYIKVDLNNRADEAPIYIISQGIDIGSATASGYVVDSQLPVDEYAPYRACNTNFLHKKKWMDHTPGDKWLQFDLGMKYYVSRWNVVHAEAGGERSTLNTKDFQLEYSHDGTTWHKVDEVIGNTEAITDREFPEVGARYWRIYITNPSQDGTDIANIYNLNLFGRTVQRWERRPASNKAANKTITIGHGTNPSNIVDESTTTKWESNTPDSSVQWFYVDLGAKYDIYKWVLKTAGVNNEQIVYNVRDFQVLFSEDATNWTLNKDVDFNVKSTVIDDTFTPVKVRYAKVKVDEPTQSAANKVRAYEFEAYGYPSLTHDNKARNVLYKSSGYNFGNYTYNACDNDMNTKWADSQSGNTWLAVDLETTRTIDRWVVKHAGAGGEAIDRNTRDYRLQKSIDGINWTDVDVVAGNTANSTDRNVTPFSARYVRLYITTPTQPGCLDNDARIYEFEVYE